MKTRVRRRKSYIRAQMFTMQIQFTLDHLALQIPVAQNTRPVSDTDGKDWRSEILWPWLGLRPEVRLS